MRQCPHLVVRVIDDHHIFNKKKTQHGTIQVISAVVWKMSIVGDGTLAKRLGGSPYFEGRCRLPLQDFKVYEGLGS